MPEDDDSRPANFVGSAAWGAAERMSGLDTIMWRAEGDPLMSATIMGVYLLDGPPPWPDFLTEHERYTRMVPRLRQRVVDRLGVGQPRWAEDELFDLEYHVRRVRLPEPGDLRAVLDLAQAVARTPFDRRRPLWEATLVEGVDGDRAGYLIKLHHSSMDGVNLVRLAGLVHYAEPPGDGAGRLSLVDRGDDLADGWLSDLLRRSVGSFGQVTALLGNPLGATRTATRMAASLVRVAAPPSASPSPLLAVRRGRSRFEALELPMEALRDAAHAAGASVNDALVAAVLAAYRRYHEHHGVPVSSEPAAVPLPARGDGSWRRGGNAFAVARLSAPVGEPDPARRMRMVRDLLHRVRDEDAGTAPVRVADALGVLPALLVTPVLRRITSAQDVQVSNLRGPGRGLAVAGSRVLRIYPFAPLVAVPASVTMLSYDDAACVGINYDAAAFTDGELFARCLHEGFEEVVQVADEQAEPPPVRREEGSRRGSGR